MSVLFSDTENIDLDLFDGEDDFEVTVDDNVEAWMMEMLSGPDND